MSEGSHEARQLLDLLFPLQVSVVELSIFSMQINPEACK
jgi:hypothetical protein